MDGWRRLCEKYTSFGEIPEGTSHAWIQWKGTNVCLDLRCECGELTHLDCDFAYLIKCGKCGAVYWPNAHITLKKLTGEDLKDAEESDPKVTS